MSVNSNRRRIGELLEELDELLNHSLPGDLVQAYMTAQNSLPLSAADAAAEFSRSSLAAELSR